MPNLEVRNAERCIENPSPTCTYCGLPCSGEATEAVEADGMRIEVVVCDEPCRREREMHQTYARQGDALVIVVPIAHRRRIPVSAIVQMAARSAAARQPARPVYKRKARTARSA